MSAGLFGGDWLLVFYFVIQLVGGIGLTVMLGVLAWPWRKRRCVAPALGARSARLTLEVGQESGPYLPLLQLVDLDVPVPASSVSWMFSYVRESTAEYMQLLLRQCRRRRSFPRTMPGERDARPRIHSDVRFTRSLSTILA
jgi:hypothetical protein